MALGFGETLLDISDVVLSMTEAALDAAELCREVSDCDGRLGDR
jgi:hypothetical protein